MMNSISYKKIVALHRTRQIKKLLIAAVITAISFAGLSGLRENDFLQILTGITCMGAFFYLIMEGLSKTLPMMFVRMKNHKYLKEKGILENAMSEIENAISIKLDKNYFAVSNKYLCLPHGVILEMNKVAWIYFQTRVVRLFFIPVMKIKCCQIKLLDGTDTLAFYGKVKDVRAFEGLLTLLKVYNPEMLIGYTAENQKLYEYMKEKYKNS